MSLTRRRGHDPEAGLPWCWANYNNFARPAFAWGRTSAQAKGMAIIKGAIALWALSSDRALRSPSVLPFIDYATTVF